MLAGEARVVMKHTLCRVSVAGLVLGWLALPAAADGLSRFEEAIKQAPPGSLTYKSAKSLGDSGFVLEDVVLTPPPDKTPGAKAGSNQAAHRRRLRLERA